MFRNKPQAAIWIKDEKPRYIVPSDTDEQEKPQKQPSLADIIVEAYKQRTGDAGSEGELREENFSLQDGEPNTID